MDRPIAFYPEFSREEAEKWKLIDDRPVAYKPILAKALKSVKAAILLSQFLYWSRNQTSIDRGGWFYKTSDELYDETGLTDKEQSGARSLLADLDILETQRRGVPAKNWYRINPKKVLWIVGNAGPMPKPHGEFLIRPEGESGTAVRSHQEVAGESNIYTETTSKTTAEKDVCFEQFWTAYPRHIAKKNAQKSWDKLSMTPELLKQILDAVAANRNSEQWQKDGGKYIPHPATWLNAERWNDEIKVVNQKPSNSKFANVDVETI